MYTSRLSATYTPEGGGDPIHLVRYGVDRLAELPEQEIDLPTEQLNFIGRTWGVDKPVGNARLHLTLTPLLEYVTVGQMQANLREVELRLMQHRTGKLELLEGYHMSVPQMRTRWDAVVTAISSRSLLPFDEALADGTHPASSLQGSANATITVSFTLTNPRQF